METIWVIIAIKTIFLSEFASQNYLDTYHMSMPIPIVENGKAYIKIAFIGQSAPIYDKPTILYEDLIIAKVSHPDLEILYEKSTVNKHNIKVKQNGEVGLLEEGDNDTLSIDQFLQAEKKYNTLLSELLKTNWLNTTNEDTQRQQIIAAELKSCWEILKVENLNPLYDSIGSDFLKWMDKHTN